MKVYGMECVVDEEGYIQRVFCCGTWCGIYRACMRRYWNNGRFEWRREGYDRETPTAQQLRRWINKDQVIFR